MAASACLQVVVTSATAASYGADVLNTVAKVTTAYLESRWSWPRKFGIISKTAYLLVDPRAATLDPHEIKKLSGELQLGLFGVGEAGDVTLAVFEGSTEDSLSFAHLGMDDLRKLLNGADMEAFGLHGRLLKNSSGGVEILKDTDQPPLNDVHDVQAAEQTNNRLLYRGVYLAPQQQFIGSILSRWSPADKRLQSVPHGPTHYPSDPETFDSETLQALIDAWPDPASAPGQIMLPLNYTALTRRGGRDRYAEFLKPLAAWPTDKLTAVLYDAPRAQRSTRRLRTSGRCSTRISALWICASQTRASKCP
jgi:hypothetical protein